MSNRVAKCEFNTNSGRACCYQARYTVRWSRESESPILACGVHANSASLQGAVTQEMGVES